MENKTPNKEQTASGSRKQPNQPNYGDKPWQNPEYGKKKKNNKDAKKDTQEESCGCE